MSSEAPMRWFVCCAWMVGCAGSATVDGSRTPGSPTCPTTRSTTGTPTEPTDTTLSTTPYQPVFRWYDQTGEPVTAGPELVVWHDGALWPLAIESGDAALPPEIGTIYYDSANCSGPGYVYAPIPMYVYTDELGGDTVLVRPSDVAVEDFPYRSTKSSAGAACTQSEGTRANAVPVDLLDVLTGSRPGYAGPLYPGP